MKETNSNIINVEVSVGIKGQQEFMVFGFDIDELSRIDDMAYAEEIIATNIGNQIVRLINNIHKKLMAGERTITLYELERLPMLSEIGIRPSGVYLNNSYSPNSMIIPPFTRSEFMDMAIDTKIVPLAETNGTKDNGNTAEFRFFNVSLNTEGVKIIERKKDESGS
jgi:hypothetical protein